MGNRGTTPSWDDEQIAKYGLSAHMRMTLAPFRAQRARERAETVEKNIGKVLELLPNATEEDQVRASFAIPDVINVLSMEDMAMDNWEEMVEIGMYKDWCKRTEQNDPASYLTLPKEDRESFRRIVEAIIQAQDDTSKA